jgi:FkbM family methyltransferase
MKRIDLLTWAYSLARRTGFLQTGFGKWLFVSSYFLYKRRLEDPFFALTQRHPELFRSGHILDIGANIGYCSTVFAAALAGGYRVFAFEPEPANFGMLQDVIASRDLSGSVVPVQAAAGESDGEIDLWLNEGHHADHRILTDRFRSSIAAPAQAVVAVPEVSIDGFLESERVGEPIAFIKIDVQGYELPVCLGLQRTLSRWPDCTVALEYMPEAITTLGFAPQDLLDWIDRQGFNVYTLRQDGGFSHGWPEGKVERGYADLLLSRRLLDAA